MVFAASSLADAFADLAQTFEDSHPGTRIELSVGGSSALREQILDGAPADVFAAADQGIMAEVVEGGHTTDPPVVFATNTLTIAVPAGNPGRIDRLEDFARTELVTGICAPGVPCGQFADQVFTQAGIEPSIDTFEPNVGSLLAKVEAGELDGGIVYTTDIRRAGDRVEEVTLPDSVEVVAAYPITALRSGLSGGAAQEFVAFILSPEGEATLAAHGFSPP